MNFSMPCIELVFDHGMVAPLVTGWFTDTLYIPAQTEDACCTSGIQISVSASMRRLGFWKCNPTILPQSWWTQVQSV